MDRKAQRQAKRTYRKGPRTPVALRWAWQADEEECDVLDAKPQYPVYTIRDALQDPEIDCPNMYVPTLQ